MTNYFAKPDKLVDAVRAVLSGQPTETQVQVDNAIAQEDIQRKADVKMIKTKGPDGKVVMKKQRKEVDIGEVDEKKHGKGDPMLKLKDMKAEAKHMDPVDKKELKGKHKDRKDKDIDNDGDVDDTDQYLHKRRKAVSKAIDGEDKDTSKEDEENAKKKKTSGKADSIDLEPKAPDIRMNSEEKMTDAQMKKREEIVMSMKDKMGEFKKKYGDRARDVMYATATKLAMKGENVEEGRGRPKKDGSGAEDEREHIQMQLRKAISLRGMKEVEFDNGGKFKIPAKVAREVLSRIDAIKNAREKQKAVQYVAKSKKHMMDFHDN